MSAPTAAPQPTTETDDTNVHVPNRRNVELGLLILALIIGMFAYANVDLAVLGELPANFLAVGAIFTLLLGGAHVAVRYLAPYADPFLLPAAALLNMLGLAMIRRLDLAEQQRAERAEIKAPSPDVIPQVTWTALALVLFVVILFVVHDHRRLQKYTYTCMVLGVLLLLSPLIPGLGTTVNGANLWIRLGPLSFQPSELAKILLTIFFAGYLVITRDSLALVRPRSRGPGIPPGPGASAWPCWCSGATSAPH